MDTEIIKRYNRERMGSVMELSDAIANMHRMLEEEGYRVVYKIISKGWRPQKQSVLMINMSLIE